MSHKASFWEHIEELRKTLRLAIVIIFAGFLICFIFSAQILNFLSPQKRFPEKKLQKVEFFRQTNNTSKTEFLTIPKNILEPVIYSLGVKVKDRDTYEVPPSGFVEYRVAKAEKKLVALSPQEGLHTALFVSFWLSLAFTSPAWLYVITSFIYPALTIREKKLTFLFAISTLLFFALGLCFGLFITVPFAEQYLYSLNTEFSENLWSLGNYFSFSLMITLANGLAFESFVVLFFLVHFQVIPLEKMQRNRRVVIVAAFILSAVLTPPDIISQFLLAIPIIIAYELILFYGVLRKNFYTKTQTSLN